MKRYSKTLMIGVLFLSIIITGIGAAQESRESWLSGFAEKQIGETISYHSPQHDHIASLLVRSLEKSRYIQWQTAPIPAEHQDTDARFVWMFGIDVNTDSHTYELYLNDEYVLTFSNPLDTLKKEWTIQGKNGTALTFRSILIDRYGDFMGYAFLDVPVKRFARGKPVTVRIVGETADSRTWYMTFQYSLDSNIRVSQEQALLKKKEGLYQSLRAEIIHLGPPETVVFEGEGERVESALKLGYNIVQLPIPNRERERDVAFSVSVGDRLYREILKVKPVQKKTCYLLHHSHVDIGYTHVQDEVERMQWSHLEKAVDLALQTQNYPPEARFKWNAEVNWHVDSYLKQASSEKRKKMLEAIGNGSIELGGLYANVLTGICRPEELFRLMNSSKRVAAEAGISLKSAMITDIPGYSWGLVPALAQAGVKYLALGTNTGHRIGSIKETWDDRPFYWVSPSGKEKVFCWIPAKGYSWFHTGLGSEKPAKRLAEKPIMDYLESMEKSDYPYDLVIFHYNIGSDNGPPDPSLSDKIRAWNEKYASPRIIIATVSEAYGQFEEKYGHSLPEMSGDFTGYWENGAASSARETAMNRVSSERLIQSEILYSIRHPQSFPHDRFRKAWEQVLLFSEHTWGSWNSISDPDGDFTKQQWEIKQSFAENAKTQSAALLGDAMHGGWNIVKDVEAIHVYNTQSWKRTDLVSVPKKFCGNGDRVTDDLGNLVPSQRLEDGSLVFLARDIPPLACKRFHLQEGTAHEGGTVSIKGNTLVNEKIRIIVDKNTGELSNVHYKGIPVDLVDSAGGSGWNGYFYVEGRNPENPQSNGTVSITTGEEGPLVGSLIVESDAPGCRSLKREIRLIAGLDRIEIINTLDKEKLYDPEGIHIVFPFHVPQGVMRMDGGWGIFRPEQDQIPGSCKNYFAPHRWTDVSNDKYGVTWASLDAPMVEVGDIRCDPTVYGWVQNLEPSQTLYSYVMNNYWETNYCATQEGKVMFRYAIQPHGAFNPGSAVRFGIERNQPLIAIPAAPENIDHQTPPFVLENQSIVLTSMRVSQDKKGWIIRLFNPGKEQERVTIMWQRIQPSAVYESSPFEERGNARDGSFEMSPFEIRTFRVEW
jgi:alpha-mannosidase